MSIKPVLSFRGLTLVTFVLSLLGIATFAFGERIFPTVLTEIFYASAAGQDSRVETEKASTNTAEKHRPTVWKALGADDRIIFGVGDRGRWDVNRVDKVQMLAPMGTPQDLATLKDFEPSWSADGSKIAFVSLRNHPPSITPTQ
ncbi:MAG: PD40 domain-containing protein [Chloracidobacterium sp.]|nr:PD40 domain-containing protein [Chloracidobacterium sp.]